jgi:predicted ATP-grasp superfamily ATP-dependent carboligase
MVPSMTALITCGQTRAGLCAVRSLGRAKIAVAVAASQRPALAMWSRYATTTFLLPSAEKEGQRFAQAVAAQAHGRNAEAFFFGTDAALWALSRWRDDLPRTLRKNLPPKQSVARVLDRAALYDLAQSLGVPCVETLSHSAGQKVEPTLLKAASLPFPVLIRPLSPWMEGEDGAFRISERITADEVGDLRKLFYERPDLPEGGCMIEPRVPGQSIGYGAVCQGGEVVAEIFQERMREERPLSEVSTFTRTIPPDEEVRQASRRLLEALSWQGPAKVEFVRTEKGDLRLVTVIGRLWGSVQLAVEAGVDVPMIWYRIASEGKSAHRQVARPGVTLRWILGDTRQLLGHFPVHVQRFHRLRAWFKAISALGEFADPRALRGMSPEVLDLDDPLPFVFEVQNFTRQTVKGDASAVFPD